MMQDMQLAPPRQPHWDRWLLGLYIATIIVISIPKGFWDPDNNFAIFRAAFGNLIAGRDLYAPHPGQYLDLFKYSPTFAVLFSPFSILPLPLSIVAWSALNALLLYYAVRRLLPGSAGTLAMALLYFEVLRNMQRAQSNSLIAALMILAFLAHEQRRQVGAALAVALGAFIKIFPLAALAMAALYPRRARMALAFGAVMIVLLALPLLVVPPHTLLAQYSSWRHVLSADEALIVATGGAGPYGGVMEQMRTLFGLHMPNWPVQLGGTVLLLLPLALRRARFEQREFRLLFLCSLLVYMVIFNFRSESPSFVIAVTGIVIWFVATPRTALSATLMVLTVVVVSLSSTEIMPHWLQRDVFVRYHLKTIPCVLAWIVIQAQLLRGGSFRQRGAEAAIPDAGEAPRLRARPARTSVKWLAPPTAVVLVVLIAFYTNARDRSSAQAVAAREVVNHLDSGERVLQSVPA
ncbi:MAG TPA: glycosyltransferase family 87 protein, partial [Gemmatimonadaceae bacterium]